VAITIKDLAEMANTSTATVSRVLSNKPGVADDKRRRIVELAERLGYSPNRIAQNLAMKKSQVLGFIAADLRNAVYVEFFRLVQAHVEPLGYQVLIADSCQDIEKEKRNIAIMREHRAEGLLIFPIHDWNAHSEFDHFLRLKLQRFPFVLVGKIEGYGFDYVTSEETATGIELVEHLVVQGHRRIGFVGSDNSNRCIRERMDGVRQGLRGAGLDLRECDAIPFSGEWQEQLRTVLRRPDRPTALVMVNDSFALIAQRMLVEMGFALPADVSVVAFGDGMWSRHLKPSLTTTDENIAEVAQASIELLLSRIDDPARPAEQRLVPQIFILRESTAPPR